MSGGVHYHGSAMIVGPDWVLELDPEASIMAKRVFARLDKGEVGQFTIRRSPEVDRLLQWFQELYPLETGRSDVAQLHAGAEAHRERATLIRRLTASDYLPQGYTLAVTPRDYQRVAADAWRRLQHLLLADDLGVGKTISALTGLADPEMRPALVVVPGNTLARQWRGQLDRCFPGIRVFVCVGTTPSAPDPWPDVVICPYHLLKHWGPVLVGRFRSVVFDEVQHMRHDDTDKYRAGRAIARSAPFVLGLSATPSLGYGGQYFAVLDLLNPGCVGTEEEFEREFCVANGEKRKRRIRDEKAFGLMLDRTGIRLRRTRKDVARELPPLTVSPITIDADPSIYEREMHGAAELARILLSQSVGKGSGLLKGDAARKLDNKMRQATGLAKAPAIAAFIRLLVENGERPVVFAHHLGVYDVLAHELRDLEPGFVTGNETPNQRDAHIARFCRNPPAGKTPTDVLILGIRAQAEGLDGLQYHSRTVVIAEPDWEGKIHDQAIGRVDRDGQTDPVTAYYLLADEGSDPIVAGVAGLKKSITDAISDPDKARASKVEIDMQRGRMLAEAWQARAGRR